MPDYTGEIVNALSQFGYWLWNAFVSIFTSLWEMATDFVCWIFDQVLGIAVTAVGALDVSGITNQLGWFDAIPGDMLAVMSACGLGSAFAIVSSALVIRFALQLIPFVRLGS